MWKSITNFFLNEWLWSITFGVYQIPVTILLLFLFLKLWDHLSVTRALVMSIGLCLSAFGIFILIFHGIFLLGFELPYVQPENPYIDTYTVFFTSISLAIIYIFLQIFVLIGVSYWFRVHYHRIIVSIIFSNILSALLIAKIVHSL